MAWARNVTTTVVIAALMIAGLVPAPANAQEDPAGRTPVGPLAVHATVAGTLALALGMLLYRSPDSSPGATPSTWRGGILLDASVRSGLRASDASDRALAAHISDVVLGVSLANSLGVAALGVPLGQDDPALAWQATSSYGLALGLAFVLGDIFKDGIGRARPYEPDCAENPEGYGCGTDDAYGSFYSLHSSVAFTSAGFSCAMHLSRSLYQDVAADAVACTTSLALATAVGVLRMVADRHYLSDVVMGAMVGFALGYVLPLFIVPSRAPAMGGPMTMEILAPLSSTGSISDAFVLGASGAF